MDVRMTIEITIEITIAERNSLFLHLLYIYFYIFPCPLW